MPRARRTPARTAPTERAAPKATADGTALPLFSNRRKRAADGNRSYTEKETKRICIGTSLIIKKGTVPPVYHGYRPSDTREKNNSGSLRAPFFCRTK